MDVGILIPITALCIPLMAIWTSHQRKLVEMRGSLPDDDRQAQRIAALEERVRVLERIATDSRSNLSAEIEALRGLPTTSEREPTR